MVKPKKKKAVNESLMAPTRRAIRDRGKMPNISSANETFRLMQRKNEQHKLVEQKGKENKGVKEEEEKPWYKKAYDFVKDIFTPDPVDDSIKKPNEVKLQKPEQPVIAQPKNTAEQMANQKNETYNQSIDVINDYNRQIDELYNAGQQIEREKKEALGISSKKDTNLFGWSPSTMGAIVAGEIAIASPYDEKLQKIQSQMDALAIQRDRYAQRMQQYNARENIIDNILANTIRNGDDYVKRQAKLDSLDTQIEENKPEKLLQIFSAPGLTFFDGADNKKFSKAVSEKYKLLHNIAESNRVNDQVIDYLIKRIKNDEAFPKRVEDFPDRLRAAAKSAFTIDGKFVLGDEHYERNLRAFSIKSPEEIKNSSEEIQKITSEENIFDKDQLQKELDWVDMQIAANKTLGDKDHIDNDDLYIQKRLLEQAKRSQEVYYDVVSDINKMRKPKSVKEITDESGKFNPLYNTYAGIRDMFLESDLTNFKNFGGKTYINPNMFLNASDLIVNWGLSNVYEKYAKGEKLTDSEKDVMLAYDLSNIYKNVYDTAKKSTAFRWGQITGESLQFMAGFCATYGVGSSLQQGGKMAAKKFVTKAFEKQLKKNAVKTVNSLGYKVVNGMAHGTGRVVADALYAGTLTGTFGLGQTLNEMQKYQLVGNLETNQSRFGTRTFDGIYMDDKKQTPIKEEDIPTTWQSISYAGTRQFIENFSEMMGEWGMSKLLGKGMFKTSKFLTSKSKKLTKLGDFLDKIENWNALKEKNALAKQANEFLQKFSKEKNVVAAFTEGSSKLARGFSKVFTTGYAPARYSGFLGEVAEEYYGIALQHLLGVADNKEKSTLQDMLDQSFDIWGGIAVSTGLLGTFMHGSAIINKVKYNKKIEQLEKQFGEDAAYEIQRLTAFTSNHRLSQLMTSLSNAIQPFQTKKGFLEKLDNLTHNTKKAFEYLGDEYEITTMKDFIAKLRGKDELNQFEATKALIDYFGATMSCRASLFSEELLNTINTSISDEMNRDAFDNGYANGNYQYIRQMRSVRNIFLNDFKNAVKDLKAAGNYEFIPQIEKILELSDKEDDTTNEERTTTVDQAISFLFDRISKLQNTSVSDTEKYGLYSAYKKMYLSLMSMQFSNNSLAGAERRTLDNINDTAKEVASTSFLYMNRMDGEHKDWIIPLRLTQKLSDEDDEDNEVTTTLYLLSDENDLPIDADGKIIVPNGKNGDKEVFVFDPRFGTKGTFTLNELAEYGFTKEKGMPVKMFIDIHKDRIDKEDDETRKKIFSSDYVRDRLKEGKIELDSGEKLTVLKTGNGYVYAAVESDGKQPQFLKFKSDSEKTAQQKLEEYAKKRNDDIAQSVAAVMRQNAGLELDSRIEDFKNVIDKQSRRNKDIPLEEKKPEDKPEDKPEGEPEGKGEPKDKDEAKGEPEDKPSSTEFSVGTTDKQEAAAKDIQDKIDDAKDRKKGLNSFHYLIEINGTLHLYRRVHSVLNKFSDIIADTRKAIHNIGNSEIENKLLAILKKYEDTNSFVNKYLTSSNLKDFIAKSNGKSWHITDKFIGTLVDDLINYYILANKHEIPNDDERRKIRLKFADLFKERLDKTLYDTFLDNRLKKISKDYIFEPQNAELKGCLEEILVAYRNIMLEFMQHQGSKDAGLAVRYFPNPTTVLGTLVDDVERKLLSRKEEKRLTDKEVETLYNEMTVHIFGEDVHLNKKFEPSGNDPNSVAREIITLDKFKELVKKSYEIKKWFADNNIVLITDEFLLYNILTVDNENVRVAGTTDAIAIDTEGNKILIDFKTFKLGKKLYDEHITVRNLSGGVITATTNLLYGDKYGRDKTYVEQQYVYNLLAGGNLFDYRVLMMLGINRFEYTTKENDETVAVFTTGESPLTDFTDDEGRPHFVSVDGKKVDPFSKEKKEQAGGLDMLFEGKNGEQSYFQHLVDKYKSIDGIHSYEDAIEASRSKKSKPTTKEALEDYISSFIAEYLSFFQENELSDFTDGSSLTQDVTRDAITLLAKYAIIKHHLDNSSFTLSPVNLGLLNNARNALNKIFDSVVKSNGGVVDLMKEIGKLATEQSNTVEEDATDNSYKFAQAQYSDNGNESEDMRKLWDVINANPDAIGDFKYYISFEKKQGETYRRYYLTVEYKGTSYKLKLNIPKIGRRTAEWFSTKISSRLKAGELVEISSGSISFTNGKFSKQKEGTPITNTLRKLFDFTGSDQVVFSKINIVGSNANVGMSVTRTNMLGELYNSLVALANSVTSDFDKYTNIFTFNGFKNNSGTFSLFVKSPFSGKKTTINLITNTIGEANANFVADILFDVDDLSGTYYDKQSELYANGFTYKDAINLFIPTIDVNYKGRDRYCINIGDKDGEKSIILHRPDGSIEYFKVSGGNDAKGAFVNAIKGIRMQTSFDFASSTLNKTPVGKCIEGLKPGETINVGSIKLTASDYMDGNNSLLGKTQGIGFYLMHGFFTIENDGFVDPIISVKEGVTFVKEQKDTVAPNTGNTSDSNTVDDSSADTKDDLALTDDDELEIGDEFTITPQSSSNDNSSYDTDVNDDDLFSTQLSELSDSSDAISEKDALEYIKSVLGDRFTVRFYDELFAQINGVEGIPVAGIARYNLIKLSRQAKRGVEYHETFHIVLELLVPKYIRNLAYSKYRKKFGKDLTDREIAEKAADDFWWYKENTPGFHITFGFKQMLNELKTWYDFYTKIGSFTLFALYKATDLGLFKNTKPSAEALQRFKRFKELYSDQLSTFKIDGKEYKYIQNTSQYNAALNTLRSIAMDPDTYKHDNITLNADGSNISEITVTIAKLLKSPAFIEMVNDLKGISRKSIAMLYEAAGLDVESIDDKTGTIKVKVTSNEAIKEALTIITRGFSQYGVSADVNNSDAYDNEDEDTLSNIIQGEKGEMQKTAAEYRSIDKQSARVKFFFSRLRRVRRIPVANYVVGDDGNIDTKRTVIQYVTINQKNEAGLYENLPMGEAWNIILNRFYWCPDVKTLLYSLKEAAEEDVQFEQIYNQYLNLFKQAVETDKNADKNNIESYFDGSVLRKQREGADNQYGLIIQILKGIHQAKVIPMVVQSMQETDDKEIKGTTKLFNADNDAICRELKKSWVKQIFSDEFGWLTDSSNTSEQNRVKLNNENSGRRIIFEELYRFADNILKVYDENYRVNVEFKHAKYTERTIEKVNGKDVQKMQIVDKRRSYQEVFDENPKLFTILAIREFVEILNRLNISVRAEDVEYAFNKYKREYKKANPGDNANDAEIFYSFYTDKLQKNVEQFIYTTKTNDRGTISIKKNVKRADIEGAGLFDFLSKIMYERASNTKELQYLTINGKRIYALSEHNYITQHLDELQASPEDLSQIMDDPYFSSSATLSSIKDGSSRFSFYSVYGLKTDAPGNNGIEYPKFSQPEDIIVKYGCLAYNGIIFPTLSDKTTYGVLMDTKNQFKLLGFDYVSQKANKNFYLSSQIKNLKENLSKYITFNDSKILGKGRIFIDFSVVDSNIIKYFEEQLISEYKSAVAELERCKKLKDSDKIESFHNGSKYEDKNGKKHTVIQGARMSSFVGYYDRNGQFISFNRIHDENGTYIDEEKNLKTVRDHFIDVSDEEKKYIINSILSMQVEKELLYLHKVGLVTYKTGSDGSSTTFENGDKVKLDSPRLKRVASMLYFNVNENTDDKKATVSAYTMKKEHISTAIIAYVSDMVVKNQQSMLEMLRLYGGNLACFKHKYDSDGYISDVTTDFFKRTGGFVSTGEYNVPNLYGISDEYTCAEVHDEKIIDELYQPFLKDSIKQTLINTFVRHKLVKNGYSLDISVANKKDRKEYILNLQEEKGDADSNGALTLTKISELIDAALENVTQTVDIMTAEEDDIINAVLDNIKGIVNNIASINSDSGNRTYSDTVKIINSVIKTQVKKALALRDVNTNDGATFITDEFFENLLKVIGKWDAKIAKSFKILRNADGKQKTSKQIRAIASAYNDVMNAAIGAQKYTAYGKHLVKGIDISGLSEEDKKLFDKNTYSRYTTYYDKTAFFPIFSCMATGHMKAVLKKMHDEKVDVLKMSSAIKEGGRKASNLDENTFRQWDEEALNNSGISESYNNFKFNSYTQKYSDLRKQFNTDPKEEELMNLGTQYVKVVLSLLHSEQIYDVNGEKLDAEDVRNQIMNCFEKIFKAQQNKFYKKYFNGGKPSVKELSKLLSKQISDKDPNDPLLKALSINNKTHKFNLPFAALNSTTWIESIVVSAINKELININTPGAAFYQRPAWAMEGAMPTDYISDEDFDYTINHGAPLKEKNEEGSSDCVLTIDFFNYLFDEHPQLKHASFEAKKAWLIKNGIISGWDYNITETDSGTQIIFNYRTLELTKGTVYKTQTGEVRTADEGGVYENVCVWKNATANIVGYRIPTQATSSIHAFRCVDVIPVLNHTVILPKAITAVTGSDFDIDKFFLSTLFYNMTSTDQKERNDYKEAKAAYFSRRDELRKIAKSRIAQEKKSGKKITKDQLDAIENEIKERLEPLRKAYDDAYDRLQLSNKFYDDEEDGYEQSCNNLLQLQIKLLRTTGNNLSQLHGSIDTDTAKLKAIANKLRKAIPKERMIALDGTSLVTNSISKTSFATGKFGIGPYALNNNNHVLTMLYGVKFKVGKNPDFDILYSLGLTDLSKVQDAAGDEILSWISGLINVHVDVAKDPIVDILCLNQYTYNLSNLLIRTGYGEPTFYFLAQPSMKKLYDAVKIASGVYGQESGVSTYTRISKAVAEIFSQQVAQMTGGNKQSNQYLAEVQLKDHFVKKYKLNVNSADEHSSVIINKFIAALMQTDNGKQILEDFATIPEERIDKSKTFDFIVSGSKFKLTYDEIQALVLYANILLQEKAQKLSNLVQYTKIDTKKQGKTIVEQAAYFDGYNKLCSENDFELNGMIDGSYIGQKTKPVIQATKDMLSTQLLQATNGYSILFNQIVSALNSDRTDTNFTQKIYDMIVAKIRSDYFFVGNNCYCRLRDIDPITLLTSNKNSIYRKLQRIKNELVRGGKYEDLLSNDGKITNYLLDNLFASEIVQEEGQNTKEHNRKFNSSQFIARFNAVVERTNELDMKTAWRDLLNDTRHPELQRFAEELIVYSFITSVTATKTNSLFHYVPEDWMIGETSVTSKTNFKGQTYGDYFYNIVDEFGRVDADDATAVGEFLQQFGLNTQDLDQLIVNFAADPSIVPTITINQTWPTDANLGNYANTVLDDFAQPVKPEIFIPVTNGFFEETNTSGERTRIQTPFGSRAWPTYVKVQNANVSKTDYLYSVYKVVAIGKRSYSSDEKDVEIYPIYALVPSAGASFRRGNRVFDVGFSSDYVDYVCNNMHNNYYSYYTTLANQLKELNAAVGKTDETEYNSSQYRLLDLLSKAKTLTEVVNSKNPDDGATQNMINRRRKVIKSPLYKFLSTLLSDIEVDLGSIKDDEQEQINNISRSNPLSIAPQKSFSKEDDALLKYRKDNGVDLTPISHSDYKGETGWSVVDDDRSSIFKDSLFKRVQTSTYKKRYIDANGNERYYYTLSISLYDKPHSGYVEIMVDTEGKDKNVYVNFVQFDPMSKNNPTTANVILNESTKNILFSATKQFLEYNSIDNFVMDDSNAGPDSQTDTDTMNTEFIENYDVIDSKGTTNAVKNKENTIEQNIEEEASTFSCRNPFLK